MKQPGLDQRHRNKNGEISRKHGNTLIATLRQSYGQHFALGIEGHKKLEDVLHILVFCPANNFTKLVLRKRRVAWLIRAIQLADNTKLFAGQDTRRVFAQPIGQ
jgi:hypothetical protein